MIHIVEDGPGFRTALTRMLGAAGFAVKTYASAGDVLDAPNDGPGCSVLDLQLPDGSGLDVQRQLAERGEALPIGPRLYSLLRERDAAPPVVFITAHQDIVADLRRSGHVCLQKPFDGQTLVAAISDACGRRP